MESTSRTASGSVFETENPLTLNSLNGGPPWAPPSQQKAPLSPLKSDPLSSIRGGGAAPQADATVKPPDSNRQVHQIHTFFVAAAFAVTMIHPVLCAYTAITKNDFTGQYVIWMELPFTAFTMFQSMIMQPKRNSRAYLRFVALHYFSYTILAEVLRTIFDQSRQQIIISVFRSLLWIAVGHAIMVGRKRISEKSPENLSDFLTHRVLKEGILAGLAQILFIMFDSVRCDFENGWENCTRTLVSGGGLSTMVVLVVGARIGKWRVVVGWGGRGVSCLFTNF